MSRTMSADPRDRMGVYKRLSDVPERYRLHNHANAYEGRDVWNEYVTDEIPQSRGDRFMDNLQRIERRWKSHMDSQGRHHALATPGDIEEWCQWLCDEFKINHAYDPYWCRLEEFYQYLQWHTDHPHNYNPVHMAVVEYPASQQIWDEKTRNLKWGANGD